MHAKINTFNVGKKRKIARDDIMEALNASENGFYMSKWNYFITDSEGIKIGVFIWFKDSQAEKCTPESPKISHISIIFE